MNIQNVDYSTKIPNNVNLAEDRQVLRALESWHPGYIDWWMDMGPKGFQDAEVYLRTAVSVDPKGWAKFDYVKMPEYRWGILLAPQEENRKIPFGRHYGEPVWQDIPGEYRAMLRRLVVIQGDTEPASVEQQRYLGKTAPSLYDMRNVFQVNVEEGRHLWAMVYILQKYFGRDGREEAAELLQRRSGDRRQAAHARRLQRSDAGLAVIPHVHLLHRPRRQDAARKPRTIRLRSAVTDLPLHADRGSASHVRRRDRRRAHHSAHLRGDESRRHRGSVGNQQESAISASSICRPSRRSSICITRCRSICSARKCRPMPPTHSPPGLKGRFQETKIGDDHRLESATYPVLKFVDGEIKRIDEPALTAINMRLRDDYTADCQRGIDRWNKIIEKTGVGVQTRTAACRLSPPDRRVQGCENFAGGHAHRRVGVDPRQGRLAAIER